MWVAHLNDVVVGVALGPTVVARTPGFRAIEAIHIAFAPRRIGMLGAHREELRGEQWLQPRRHQVRRDPPIHHNVIEAVQ